MNAKNRLAYKNRMLIDMYNIRRYFYDQLNPFKPAGSMRPTGFGGICKKSLHKTEFRV